MTISGEHKVLLVQLVADTALAERRRVAVLWLERAIKERLGLSLAAHGDAVAANIAMLLPAIQIDDAGPVLRVLGRVRKHVKDDAFLTALDYLERAGEQLESVGRAKEASSADELLLLAELVRKAAASLGCDGEEMSAQLDDLAPH